ncbi:MAG TPA: response regulator transcription factor, partial [Stenomitos sp.]
MKVLLIEDDEAIIAALSHNLATYHYVLDAVTDGTTGWTYATTYEYDLIILDIMLPKMNGIRFCEWFREEGYTTPILLLTVLDTSQDKVRGLDAGADDYVVKPFEVNELSARIRALLRRGKASPFPLLMWEDLMLNPSTLEVTYKEKPLTLTVKEYELLELFLRDCKHVFSSEEILDKLWSSEEFPVEATVRSHIRRLRNKLVSAGAPHDFISTIHGRGYYLKPLPQEPPTPAVATVSGVDTASAAQQAYVEFLNETWAT